MLNAIYSFRALTGAMGLAMIVLGVGAESLAQSPVDARWMWYDEGEPAVEAPPGSVWFRREARANEPSTGAVRIACDDRFVLWVNGRRVGQGGGGREAPGTGKSFRFNLNGIVGRGVNVIAIEAFNESGRAGILVEGEIRGQSGSSHSLDSPREWLATRRQPGEGWLAAGFDTADWDTVADLGAHEQSPWKAIQFGESYLDRYQLAEGFEIERIAEPQLVGSLIAIGWGPEGRLLTSREGGGIQNVIDEDGDGVYEGVSDFCGAVTSCQGLCSVADGVYAVGNGPQGTGMYRLRDQDGDGTAEEILLVTGYRGGMGEHGPHAVVLAPDGGLYHNVGNHAWITHEVEANSPIRDYYEGDLLRPRYEDPNGHAAGIPAPGGTIWRFSPDGRRWSLVTNGFRNHYDFAFNAAGDMFTFDSDMEWEVGMPFYKPVRVMHCTSGADFGWRSNAGKWPEYYIDSLSATVDVGRGSPTGVVFYEHDHFPSAYRGALLACDWSMGRIGAVRLERNGASYTGTWQDLVTGNPLNVSDIEVDRDGTVIFATGGRGTEGGLYRVSHRDTIRREPPAESLADALAMPQLSSAWARQACAKIQMRLGDRWQAGLAAAARGGDAPTQMRALALLSQLGPPPAAELLIDLCADDDEAVRAAAAWLLKEHAGPKAAEALAGLLADRSPLAARRALEAFVAGGMEPPVEPVIRLLGSEDRFVRYAAVLAIARLPSTRWRREVLASGDPRVVIHGLLALRRAGADAIAPVEALQRELAVWDAHWHEGNPELKLGLLRMIELTLLDGAAGPTAQALGDRLLGAFAELNSGGRERGEHDGRRNDLLTEISRILCHLQRPEAAAAIIHALEQPADQALRIHYALATSYLKQGWSFELNRRLFDWYETTRSWEGGHSFGRWLENIMTAHLAHVPAEDRGRLIADWRPRPFASRLILRASEPGQIARYEEVIGGLLADLNDQPHDSGGEEMVSMAIASLARSESAAAQDALGKLYEQLPDRREQIARGMAEKPSPAYFDHLVRTLDFADSTTLQLCIAALRRMDRQPEGPGAVRAAILAGLKLGSQGGLAAADLLEKWTGSPHGAGLNPAAALSYYQGWFSEHYPDAPAAELPQSTGDGLRYSYAELMELLEEDAAAGGGDARRGEAVFAKANCIKCHRFKDKGEGVGPDLSAVRRRFQRKEIVESLAYPSQVISDQYRSVIVTTLDGQVYTGMPASVPDAKGVVLLLSDATRLEIPKENIDEIQPARISVMPEGLLKELSPGDIADLFAFLETSKDHPLPEGK